MSGESELRAPRLAVDALAEAAAAAADPAAWRLHLGLHPDVARFAVAEGAASLRLAQGLEARIDWRDAALGAALRRLGGGGLAWEDWTAMAEAAPGEAETALVQLISGRLLTWWHGAPGLRAVEFRPLSGRYAPLSTQPAAPGLRLPATAVAAWGPEGLVIDAPGIDARVTVGPAGLRLVGALLAHGRDGAPELPASARRSFAAAGLLRPAGEAEEPGWREWTAWSALAHRSTRELVRLRGLAAGQADRPFDAAAMGPRRAWERSGLPRVALPRPAPEDRSQPLADLLESRRSRREPAARPLDLGALGRLLWRAARRRTDLTRSPELVLRNMPGGGGKADLSVYLAVGRCLGLPRGFYGYDDVAHALVRFPDPEGEDPVGRILDESRQFMSAEAPADVIAIGAWRPGAMAPKYGVIAYRLGLLHAGVLAQTLYLLAEDLGLAACALGLGDHGHFARATGVDPRIETSLIEFALSGRG